MNMFYGLFDETLSGTLKVLCIQAGTLNGRVADIDIIAP